MAFGHLLQAVDFYLAPVREVAIVGPSRRREALVRVVRGAYRPHLVLGRAATRDGVPLLEGRDAGRRPRGRLRVRALRLPGAGDHAERAGGGAAPTRTAS